MTMAGNSSKGGHLIGADLIVSEVKLIIIMGNMTP